MATANFGLPFIAGGQAQKHVTHNESLDVLDALIPSVVISATETSPVGTPAEGDCYIVPTGGSFGATAVGDLVVYTGGAWRAIPSRFGHRILVLDQGREWINGGSQGWVPGQVIGPQGGTLGVRVVEFEVDLSVGGTSVTVSGAIPSRVIVFGVTSWVGDNITGPDQFKVGTPSEVDKFGSYIWRDAPSSNIGVVGPFATYSPTDLVVTSQDESTAFTGGTVHLSALILEPGQAPT